MCVIQEISSNWSCKKLIVTSYFSVRNTYPSNTVLYLTKPRETYKHLPEFKTVETELNVLLF